MKQRWEDYDRAAEHGPVKIALLSVTGIFIVGGFIAILGYGFGWFNDAADVAKQEFSASASLKKYEWFKDVHAQLDKKQADIRVYEVRTHTLEQAYADSPRSKWARVDAEAYNLAVTELAGLKASYNQLAAEYNSQSSKFNWSYAEGSLPQTIQPMVEQ